MYSGIVQDTNSKEVYKKTFYKDTITPQLIKDTADRLNKNTSDMYTIDNLIDNFDVVKSDQAVLNNIKKKATEMKDKIVNNFDYALTSEFDIRNFAQKVVKTGKALIERKTKYTKNINDVLSNADLSAESKKLYIDKIQDQVSKPLEFNEQGLPVNTYKEETPLTVDINKFYTEIYKALDANSISKESFTPDMIFKVLSKEEGVVPARIAEAINNAIETNPKIKNYLEQESTANLYKLGVIDVKGGLTKKFDDYVNAYKSFLQKPLINKKKKVIGTNMYAVPNTWLKEESKFKNRNSLTIEDLNEDLLKSSLFQKLKNQKNTDDIAKFAVTHGYTKSSKSMDTTSLFLSEYNDNKKEAQGTFISTYNPGVSYGTDEKGFTGFPVSKMLSGEDGTIANRINKSLVQGAVLSNSDRNKMIIDYNLQGMDYALALNAKAVSDAARIYNNGMKDEELKSLRLFKYFKENLPKTSPGIKDDELLPIFKDVLSRVKTMTDGEGALFGSKIGIASKFGALIAEIHNKDLSSYAQQTTTTEGADNSQKNQMYSTGSGNLNRITLEIGDPVIVNGYVQKMSGTIHNDFVKQLYNVYTGNDIYHILKRGLKINDGTIIKANDIKVNNGDIVIGNISVGNIIKTFNNGEPKISNDASPKELQEFLNGLISKDPQLTNEILKNGKNTRTK